MMETSPIKRETEQAKRRSRTYIFLALSLLTHVVIFVSLLISKLPKPPAKPVAVEVEYIDPAPKTEDGSPLKKQRSASVTDQIVEQKNQINDELDEKSRFLSAFNQRVEKQTRAEQSGKFNNTAKGGHKEDGEKSTERTESNSEKKVAQKNKAPKEAGDLPDLKDLAPKFTIDPGPKSADAKENGDPSQTDDYLQDVKTGMQTLLSSREFVYYSYYARIKEAIRQHWEPDVRERVKIIYRQGRNIASSRDRITQVLVTLNSKGELIKVDVLNESGVEQLDAAAVEAFRSAAPFPNPPKGMVESDGTIKIRWDFVLEV